MKYRVKFMPANIQLQVEENTLIMDAARENAIYIDAPCGGNGKCGKCTVIIDGVEQLACQTKVDRDMTVLLPESPQGHHVLKAGTKAEYNLDAPVKAIKLNIEKPAIGGKKSDWEAVIDAFDEKAEIKSKPYNNVLCGLHTVLEKTNYKPEALILIYDNELFCLREAKELKYAMAFDIGTTTVVGYLLELESGKEIEAVSVLNPQSAFGADVIQRAGYAGSNGTAELTSCIRNAINSLIDEAAAKAGISNDDIILITAVGNTCMSHLMLGVTPESLTVAPYLPVIRSTITERAEEIGITSAKDALFIMLPNIGGFVGADTVGAILACSMDTNSEINLMIDIGTNGELALGNKDKMVSCSTAAGPAFEGALIECGMRGAQGAIDHLKLANGKIEYSVIGNVEATGICGSGLIDIVSELVRIGIVDESGRIVSESELDEAAAAYAANLSGEGANRRFAICKAVYITQKDIREVQLAKGAMAAGLKILMKELGISYDSISKVLIAGAFGNYMEPESACGISLIPKELRKKIAPVGNAAGIGAQLCALDKEMLKRATHISEYTDYIELAAIPEFQDIFVDELEF